MHRISGFFIPGTQFCNTACKITKVKQFSSRLAFGSWTLDNACVERGYNNYEQLGSYLYRRLSVKK